MPQVRRSSKIHETTSFVLVIRVISWVVFVRSKEGTKSNSKSPGSSQGRRRMIRAFCFWLTRPIPSALLLLALFLALPACVRRSRDTTLSNKATEQLSAIANQQASRHININTASANELETLPGIGKGLAARIIEHRTEYGPFRRPEHLIMVRGISDQRIRALHDLITVE